MRKYWLEYKYLDHAGKEKHEGRKITQLIELTLLPEEDSEL